MTPEQTKKYEEAANHHSDTHFSFHSDITAMQRESFFMGCELASQDTEERVKQAHNEAIDKALTTMKIAWREDRHEIYNEIQKLKL